MAQGNKTKADELFDLAVAEHSRAYEAAKAITCPDKRQDAYRAADSVYELQREYQRKVRCGEA